MLELDLQGHKPLRELVYDSLKKDIMTCKVKPGTRMMEVELANDMGVSRTPIREAIRKLEKDGLVVIEPRRGAYVSNISVKDMLDTMEVREELEGLAAYLTAARITDEEIDELLAIKDKYKSAVAKENTEDMIKYDEEFHGKIVEFSSNNTLIRLYETVQELTLRFRYLYYDDFSRYEKMPQEHMEIIDALRTGDQNLARTTCDSHVKRLRDFVIEEGKTAFKDFQ